jgi:hypothetical protein
LKIKLLGVCLKKYRGSVNGVDLLSHEASKTSPQKKGASFFSQGLKAHSFEPFLLKTADENKS